MNNLLHETIIRYLLICVENGIALDTETPYEWAEVMGYPVRNEVRLQVTSNITLAGRKLNRAFGKDLISTHFVKWADNPNYDSGL